MGKRKEKKGTCGDCWHSGQALRKGKLRTRCGLTGLFVEVGRKGCPYWRPKYRKEAIHD